MNKQKSLKLNFIMNASLIASSLLFSLITFSYVSRILLPVGTGKVDFATSVIVYFSIFAQLGIPTYGIRAIAKVRDDKQQRTKVAQELLIINLAMSIITYILLFILISLVGKLQEERLLLIVMSSTILLSAIGMEWLYKGMEEYVFIAIVSLVFKIIAIIGIYVLVRTQSDYILYGAFTIFASTGTGIANFIHARKLISFKPVKNYELMKHLKIIGIFFAMACATQIYTHLDTIMLGFMKGDEEVGIYNAAVRIKIALVGTVSSLAAVLLPRSSYYVEHKLMEDFKNITSMALNFIVLLSSAFSLYFIFYAKEAILFLSGTAYLGAVLPMQLIMPTVLFIGLTNILGIQILVPLGKEKVVLASVVVGAIVDLFINVIFIPKYGATGAAVGTLVAEIVVLIYQFIALQNEYKASFYRIEYLKIIIALAVGLGASAWVKLLDVPPLISLILSACCYFAVYGILLLIEKEEFVCKLLKRRVKK